MEIRHSSPQTARPVEVHAGKRRWPWIVLIIIGAVAVLGGVVAALYFYGGSLISRDESTANSNSDQQNVEGGAGEATSSSSIASVDVDDLTNLVLARFGEVQNNEGIGSAELTTVDATDSGELRESDLLSIEAGADDSVMNIVVSPNGQFAAVSEDDGSVQVSLVELANGKTSEVTSELPGLVAKPIWSPDSAYFVFGDIRATDEEAQHVYTYDVAQGQLADVVPSDDPSDLFIPFIVTEDDVFGVQTLTASESPGSLGAYGFSRGELDSDFESIIEMPAQSRGFDVTSDGEMIVLASASGDSLGLPQAPFQIELLARDTGEITELRSSSSEEYSDPHFMSDGKSIIYGAASGLWMLELDSEDRVQLIESSELGTFDDVVRPLLINPSDEFVVAFTSDADSERTYYVVPLDAEEALLDEIGTVEHDTDALEVVLGWTD